MYIVECISCAHYYALRCAFFGWVEAGSGDEWTTKREGKLRGSVGGRSIEDCLINWLVSASLVTVGEKNFHGYELRGSRKATGEVRTLAAELADSVFPVSKSSGKNS